MIWWMWIISILQIHLKYKIGRTILLFNLEIKGKTIALVWIEIQIIQEGKFTILIKIRLNQTYTENSANNDLIVPNINLNKQNSFGSSINNDFDNNFYNQQIAGGTNNINKESKFIF